MLGLGCGMDVLSRWSGEGVGSLGYWYGWAQFEDGFGSEVSKNDTCTYVVVAQEG